jgi:hypothetical protein
VEENLVVMSSISQVINSDCTSNLFSPQPIISYYNAFPGFCSTYLYTRNYIPSIVTNIYISNPLFEDQKIYLRGYDGAHTKVILMLKNSLGCYSKSPHLITYDHFGSKVAILY